VFYPYLLVSFALFKFKAIHPRTYTNRCGKQGGGRVLWEWSEC